MARVLIDGYESGNGNAWDTFGGNVVVSGTYAYTGSYGAYYQNNSTAYSTKSLNSISTIYGAFRYNSSSGNRGLFSLNEGGTNHANIYMTDAGGKAYLLARRHTSNLANSLPNYMDHNKWYLVEFYIYIHDSSGRFQVKVNGITWLDFTGDTRNGGTGVLTNFVMGFDSILGTGAQVYIDDLVLDDANWIGNTRIYGISPDGAGATTQWSPSAGSNYQCVDEVPESDSDYVSVNSNDQIDTYSLANLGVSPYSVKSVQASCRAQKEGASTPQNIALVLRQGGTDYPGSDQALETSFRGHAELWENDPNTSSPWTESGVNSLEAGVKSRA